MGLKRWFYVYKGFILLFIIIAIGITIVIILAMFIAEQFAIITLQMTGDKHIAGAVFVLVSLFFAFIFIIFILVLIGILITID